MISLAETGRAHAAMRTTITNQEASDISATRLSLMRKSMASLRGTRGPAGVKVDAIGTFRPVVLSSARPGDL